MKTRFIALGCSYTHYSYPTWADFIGVNYNEYYNFGCAGASNTYIMNRLLEFDNLTSLNSETDVVMIMLTGFGRFSFLEQKNERNSLQWATYGDLNSYYHNTKDKKIEIFLQNMWTEDFAVYQSWIAATTIKKLLTLKNIEHTILMGIDNSLYKDYNGITNLCDNAITKSNQIYNLLDISMTFDEWKKTKDFGNESVFWENIGGEDGHPSPNVHYKFIEEFFPEKLTKLSQELKSYWETNIDHRSQTHQGEKFNKFFTNVFYESNKINTF